MEQGKKSINRKWNTDDQRKKYTSFPFSFNVYNILLFLMYEINMKYSGISIVSRSAKMISDEMHNPIFYI